MSSKYHEKRHEGNTPEAGEQAEQQRSHSLCEKKSSEKQEHQSEASDFHQPPEYGLGPSETREAVKHPHKRESEAAREIHPPAGEVQAKELKKEAEDARCKGKAKRANE
ncbi:MAG: hypothetical protein GF398_10880 [Chitinivibrionales bacterium]|nr:hypothetical protein [Chitinivibrionales bacterium]